MKAKQAQKKDIKKLKRIRAVVDKFDFLWEEAQKECRLKVAIARRERDEAIAAIDKSK